MAAVGLLMDFQLVTQRLQAGLALIALTRHTLNGSLQRGFALLQLGQAAGLLLLTVGYSGKLPELVKQEFITVKHTLMHQQRLPLLFKVGQKAVILLTLTATCGEAETQLIQFELG